MRNFNTTRIVGDYEESNGIDPAANERILPYILKEDLLDLLAGGTVVNLPDERLDASTVLENLISRGFNPTTYVYYSNDTKEADTECYYQEEDLIYYSRSAYHYSPFQKVGLTGEAKEIKTEFRQEDVTLLFSVYPIKAINSERAEYIASCSFFNDDCGPMGNLYENAKISLNGIRMKNIHGNFFRIDGHYPVLNSGDIITFKIEDQSFGEITGELTVPAPLNSFSLEPELEMGIPSVTDEYLLQWDQQDCDEYDLTVDRAF